MDDQLVINLLFALCGALGGWVLNSLSKAQIALAKDLKEIEVIVAKQYVTRDELREDLESIDKKLDKIFTKLDAKADK